MSARASSADGPGRSGVTRSPATSRRSTPCQPNATQAVGAGWSAHASGSSLATGARIQRRRRASDPGRPSTGTGDPDPRLIWTRPSGASWLWNTGPLGSGRAHQLDARIDQEVELPGVGRELVDADERTRADAQAGARQRAVGDAAAQAPAARVGLVDVARGGTDDDHVRRAVPGPCRSAWDIGPPLSSPPILGRDEPSRWTNRSGSTSCTRGTTTSTATSSWRTTRSMTSRSCWSWSSRPAPPCSTRYTEDTLSEAIANELARRHGFLVVDDSQLRVAITVSAEEGETAVANVDLGPMGRDDDDDHRSILIDVEPEERLWGTGLTGARLRR